MVVTIRRHRIKLVIVASLLSSSPAYAYIDPGTGSFILQGLLASIAVALGVARTYWERIRAFFSTARPTQDIDSRIRDDAGEDVKSQHET